MATMLLSLGLQAQEYNGLTGLLQVPSAETDSAGTFRGGGMFLDKRFTPAKLNFQGEKYNTFSYGVGTNWQKEVFNRNAPQQTHEVSVSGASDRVNYYLALGYTDQQGIVGGNWGRSNYNRLTLRSNTSFTLVDKKSERNYLNSIVLQNQLSYAKISSKGISENSQWGSPLGSALAMSPILGVYASDEDVANYRTIYPGETLLQAADGRYYMIPGGAYNEMNNPIADLSRPANDNWSHKFVGGLS